MSLLEFSIKGRRKQLEGEPRTLIFREIYQNAVDTDAKVIRASLKWCGSPSLAELTFEDDDPEGFKRLSDSYTIFDESLKGGDPTKRGRFNRGEKDVIILSESVTIETTKGAVEFDVRKNQRTEHRRKRPQGSLFLGVFKLTKAEFAEIEAYAKTVIPPQGVQVFFNDALLVPKVADHSFEATLPTVKTDEEGVLRPTERKTRVSLYEVAKGDTARIYELGIPVVELDSGEKFHVDVQQRVPLNAERDNVPPAYLRKLRTQVLNESISILEPEDLTAKWVDAALESKDVSREAVLGVVHGRHGDKVAGATPFDKEAEDNAKALGFEIVGTRAYSAEARESIRRFEAIPPATQVAPSQKDKSDKLSRHPAIAEEKWTPDQRRIIEYTIDLARELMDVSLEVRIVSAPESDVVACYRAADEEFRDARFTYNLGHSVMGDKFFARAVIDVKVNELIIHEFAHQFESNHLNVGYHDALSNLGAKLAKLVFENPSFFTEKGAKKLTPEQLAKKR